MVLASGLQELILSGSKLAWNCEIYNLKLCSLIHENAAASLDPDISPVSFITLHNHKRNMQHWSSSWITCLLSPPSVLHNKQNRMCTPCGLLINVAAPPDPDISPSPGLELEEDILLLLRLAIRSSQNLALHPTLTQPSPPSPLLPVGLYGKWAGYHKGGGEGGRPGPGTPQGRRVACY